MIKQKNLVFVLSSSAVVTIAWIGFTIYHTAVTSTLDETLTDQIRPIPASFDEATIRDIMNRRDVPPTYEISGGNSPTPTISQTAESSIPATSEVTTPTATPPEREREETL